MKIKFEGKEFIVPDDASEQEINDIIESESSSQLTQHGQDKFNESASLTQGQPQPQQQGAVTDPMHFNRSGSEGLRGSFIHSMGKGAKDVLDAGAQGLYHAMPESVQQAGNQLNDQMAEFGLTSKMPEQGGIDQMLQQDERNFQIDRERANRGGLDMGRVVGNVAATLPLVSAKGLQLGQKGVGFRGNAARAGLQGGIVGASQPVLDGGNFWESKVDQAGLGAAFGAGSYPLGTALGRMISPKSTPEAQLLLKEGVNPTAGQLLGGWMGRVEDKAMSLPIIGDAIRHGRTKAQEEFNRAAYKRALKGMDVNVNDIPLGKAGTARIRQILDKEYNDLLPKMTFKTDKNFFDEMDAIKAEVKKIGGKEEKYFNDLMDDLYQRGKSNTLDGDSYKTIESKLFDEASDFKGSTDPLQRKLGRQINEAINAFKGAMTRNNPKYADRYKQVNDNYANYVRISGATKSTANQSDGFTPSQLAMGVKGADKSVRKQDFSSNKALMSDLSDAGVSTMNQTIPNSGTIDRLLLAGGLGGVGFGLGQTLPLLGAASVASVPALARKTMASLLAKRPEELKKFGKELTQISPVVGAASAPALQ